MDLGAEAGGARERTPRGSSRVLGHALESGCGACQHVLPCNDAVGAKLLEHMKAFGEHVMPQWRFCVPMDTARTRRRTEAMESRITS